MTELRTGQPKTFTDWLRNKATVITGPVAGWLHKLRIHPNAVTVVGLLLSGVPAAALATGRISLGGVLLLLTSSVDAFDGSLARLSGQQSRFGAFLDSSLDRCSDGVLLFGLLPYLLATDRELEIYLTFAALLGFVMVSYTRARAEGVGYECKTGILTRVPRILVLGIGLALGRVLPTLVLLVAFSWFTVWQRISYVYRQAQEESLGSKVQGQKSNC